MTEDEKLKIIETIAKREKLRPLSRTKRLFRDPINALPYYILATAGHIKPFRITFHTLWGDKMVGYLPETNTFYYYGFCEANLTAFLLRYLKEGDNFIDVGANIGFYTVLASRLVGKDGQVHSFEPTPSTFETLKDNTRHLNNVILNNFGVSNIESKFILNDFGTGYTAFNTANPHGTILNRPSKQIAVDTISLDGYLNLKRFKPTFIKLDAEGHEHKIVEGLKQTLLGKDRPLITLEMANDELWVDNYKISSQELLNRDYTPYEMTDDGYIFPCEIKANYTYNNILFIPLEKKDSIKELIKKPI
jgi:FkbM family methyltransferase